MHVEEKAQRISLFVIGVNRMIVENKGIINVSAFERHKIIHFVNI